MSGLSTLLADLKEQEALDTVKKMLGDGLDPMQILAEAREGMQVVGQRFGCGEYFIPDLIYSGEILKGIAQMVEPYIKSSGTEAKKLGKVIIATVAGDIHDIGKDLVVFMLDISGYEVYDLGIDVPIQTIVSKIRETGATVVGLSGFLTLAFDAMKETIEAIKEAGLRDNLKVMIGGGQIDEEVRKYTGADAYGRDAMAAVTLTNGWLNQG
ncbi:MAG: methionine synthase [Deltaproteobacteria bacterium]|jgi:5-methyltetrahydrofolate--homocysteine methyltransferase|nr:methionine synthase [Deltaproteobacteria bacterium]